MVMGKLAAQQLGLVETEPGKNGEFPSREKEKSFKMKYRQGQGELLFSSCLEVPEDEEGWKGLSSESTVGDGDGEQGTGGRATFHPMKAGRRGIQHSGKR